jgi:hypothetical protein
MYQVKKYTPEVILCRNPTAPLGRENKKVLIACKMDNQWRNIVKTDNNGIRFEAYWYCLLFGRQHEDDD